MSLLLHYKNWSSSRQLCQRKLLLSDLCPCWNCPFVALWIVSPLDSRDNPCMNEWALCVHGCRICMDWTLSTDNQGYLQTGSQAKKGLRCCVPTAGGSARRACIRWAGMCAHDTLSNASCRAGMCAHDTLRACMRWAGMCAHDTLSNASRRAGMCAHDTLRACIRWAGMCAHDTLRACIRWAGMCAHDTLRACIRWAGMCAHDTLSNASRRAGMCAHDTLRACIWHTQSFHMSSMYVCTWHTQQMPPENWHVFNRASPLTKPVELKACMLVLFCVSPLAITQHAFAALALLTWAEQRVWSRCGQPWRSKQCTMYITVCRLYMTPANKRASNLFVAFASLWFF